MSCKFLVLLKMIIFVFYMLIDSLEVLHCGCSLHVDLEGCLLSGTRFVSESFFFRNCKLQ